MTARNHRPDLDPSPKVSDDKQKLGFRPPTADDGPAINALIARCPPLDTNSLYCNLLQASHFADCCILAEQAGRTVGWISGYRLPDDPQTLFVWQVAVDARARGRGLAGSMLEALLSRPSLADIRQVQTTITPSNKASWGLFRRLAASVGTGIRDRALFDGATHFGGGHESEHLVTIGPLTPVRAAV